MSRKLFLWMVVLAAMWVHLCVAEVPLYTRDNVLIGINFNDGPGSSDMTLIMRLSGDDEIYVDEGSPVKYIHSPDNQDIEGWTELEFDDSDWKDGVSGVGFSDGDDNTQVPAGLISIWTRYHFDAPNASSVKEVILLADYDDQYIAWLNGVEIARSAGAPGAAGDVPAWNATQGGCPNHGSSELPAGKPNKSRWDNARVEETAISVKFAGNSALAVEISDKLAITWGDLKRVLR